MPPPITFFFGPTPPTRPPSLPSPPHNALDLPRHPDPSHNLLSDTGSAWTTPLEHRPGYVNALQTYDPERVSPYWYFPPRGHTPPDADIFSIASSTRGGVTSPLLPDDAGSLDPLAGKGTWCNERRSFFRGVRKGSRKVLGKVKDGAETVGFVVLMVAALFVVVPVQVVMEVREVKREVRRGS